MKTREEIMSSVRQWRNHFVTAGLIGVGACALLAVFRPNDFYRMWLVAYLPCWAVTIGCLMLAMLHHLVGGNWGRAARPVFEAGASMLPLLAIAFLPIAAGIEQLYPWAGAEAASDPVIQHKAAYLNPSAFLTRAVGYFAIWIVTWLVMVRGARRWGHDAKGHEILWPRRASLGLVLVIVSASFAAIDWAMSLEPHWFSAIYGAIYLACGAVGAMALAAVGVGAWELGASVPKVRSAQIRADLGSLLLAFLMLWAYFALSQFLIIWMADLPEENVWYLARGRGGWQFVVLSVIAFHFVAPFFVLLSRDAKEYPGTLVGVAVAILAMEIVYVTWLVAPAFYASVAELPVLGLPAIIGLPALWAGMWLVLVVKENRIDEK